MKSQLLKSTFTVMLLCSAGQAAAQDIYFGAGVGSVSSDLSGYDDSSGAGKVFIGGQAEGVSFELGYVDLGKFEQTGAVQNYFEVDGFQINAIGEIFLSKGIDGYASFGFYNWDSKVTGTGNDDSGTTVTFGLGVKFALGDHLFARGGWERFNDIVNESSDMLSLNFGYRF